MNLADVFENLSYGELSQLAIGNLIPDDSQSEVSPKDYAKVMSHINMALRQLYTRFFLASKELIIQQEAHIETYELSLKYARTNKQSSEPYKYIIDSKFEPFLDDVLKIEQVFNEAGELMFLNNRTEPWSVFTPTYRSIQVPFPDQANTLTVQYRAAHPTLVYIPGLDPKDIEIQLPLALLEPLLLYVGHRALRSMNVDNNAESTNYLALFEASVARITKQGLQVTPEYGNEKLDIAGWA